MWICSSIYSIITSSQVEEHDKLNCMKNIISNYLSLESLFQVLLLAIVQWLCSWEENAVTQMLCPLMSSGCTAEHLGHCSFVTAAPPSVQPTESWTLTIQIVRLLQIRRWDESHRRPHLSFTHFLSLCRTELTRSRVSCPLLVCRHVQLNGERLLLSDNETFPELKPKTLRAGRTIAMPPLSIGFYVIKNINAYACRR